MINFKRIFSLVVLFIVSLSSGFALENKDHSAIQQVIQGYTEAWNKHAGVGFGDGFSENASFVNIFGMLFWGRAEIEARHVAILQAFLKDSTLEISDVQLQEIQPGIVVALVHWKVSGFQNSNSEKNSPTGMMKGIFTQLFVNNDNKWEIRASQNTLIAEKQKHL